MKKQILFLILITFCFLIPVESSAKKRRVFKRKWSISLANGYSYYWLKKASVRKTTEWGDLEGQMHLFFSALEISRNMGYYEIGAKIQHLGPTFVSPFFKVNLNKNNSRAFIIPSLTVGVVPSHVMGVWLRLSLALSLNRYMSIAPFAGTYAWYKLKDDAEYEKFNIHLNAGLKINLYY